jgi:hypothetical protein
MKGLTQQPLGQEGDAGLTHAQWTRAELTLQRRVCLPTWKETALRPKAATAYAGYTPLVSLSMKSPERRRSRFFVGKVKKSNTASQRQSRAGALASRNVDSPRLGRAIGSAGGCWGLPSQPPGWAGMLQTGAGAAYDRRTTGTEASGGGGCEDKGGTPWGLVDDEVAWGRERW